MLRYKTITVDINVKKASDVSVPWTKASNWFGTHLKGYYPPYTPLMARFTSRRLVIIRASCRCSGNLLSLLF